MRESGKYALAAMLVSLVQVIRSRTINWTDDMTIYFQRMLNFQVVTISAANMMDLVLGMVPILIFEVLGGVYLYQHFCTANVYYFSRQADRNLWFGKECLKLYGYMVWYYFIMAVGSVLWGELVLGENMPNPWSVQGVKTACICIGLWGMFTYIFTLLINLLSIKFGSQNATVVVIGVQYFLIMLLGILGARVVGVEEWSVMEAGQGYWIIRLNPIANMVVQWHSGIEGFQGLITNDDELVRYPLSYSWIYYGIGILLVMAVGLIIVKHHDIGMENKEEQG